MGLCARIFRLFPVFIKKYWIVMAWTATCSVVFYIDYMRYKKEPQYYYVRRMLGLGMCISRGTAAVLNLSCCVLVLPMCRALITTMGALISPYRTPRRTAPALPAVLAAPATHAAKSTHMMVAATIVLTSVAHTGAHMANAVNFSRHFSTQYPELNVATFRGETPLRMFVATVPGITGIMMVFVLGALCLTSIRCVRRRGFDIFYYTHRLGFIFLLLLMVHPLSGVLKEQKNVGGHVPGCQMYKEMSSEAGEVGYPEPDNVGSPEAEVGYPEPEVGYPEPEVGYPESDNVGSPEAEIGYPEPDEIGSPDSEVGYPEPDYISIPELEIGYPEPDDVGSPELEIGYPEPDDVGSPDLEIGYPEPLDVFRGNEDSSDVSRRGERISYHRTRKKRRKCRTPPVFGAIHSRTWVWVGVALIVWAIDWLVRIWRRRTEVEIVSVSHHPCDVVQMTLRQKGFACLPGQFVMLQCPQVSCFEWHPFTVTII